MPTSYTTNLGLALPVQGELAGTWGDVVNNSITSLLDSAIAGTTTLSSDANVTLTTTTGAANEARQAVLLFTGARTAIRTVTAPARTKTYVVINATTGGFAVNLVGAGPTTGVTIAAGEKCLVAWNSGDFVKVASSVADGVTSVAMTVPTGLSISGSPITSAGTLALTLTAGYSIPTTASQTNWDSAYTQRLQWDGGSTNLVAATGRTSLGGTTAGQNFFTLTNPSAITFPRINADNTVSALNATDFRTAIGAGTSSTTGTVTSVGMTVPAFLSVSGSPITGSGTLAVSYSGTALPVANGGTGQTTTQAAINSLAGAVTSGQYLRGNGTNVVMSAIQAADVPTLNQNTTGTASNVTGTVAVANGGTGATTAANARTNLGGTTVGQSYFTLTNPSAITFPRMNADNTVSALNAADFRTAIGAGTGAGSVTSVAVSGGTTGLTTSGGPITTSGTITLAGTLATANGGTGQTTAQAAINSLAGAVTSGQYLRGNGTNVVMSAIQAADVPTLNQNTTGTASNVTGTVAIANGGTGATTAASARTNLGASTVGSNFYTLTNPSAITFPRINADNTVSALDAATFRTAIGAGTGGGSVSSVDVSGGTTGLTTSGGPVTSSGTITLAGTLGVSNGGTGATTLTGVLKGNGTSAFTAATAGTDYVAPGTATTFTALQTFTGSTSVLAAALSNAAEKVTVSATAATGTINFDVTTQSVLYYTTTASGNWTLNVRASSGTSLNTALATGQSVTIAFLVTQGATAYYQSALQIDGASVTPKWQGGTAPAAGNASSIDAYVITIIKTGSATFTALASQTKFA